MRQVLARYTHFIRQIVIAGRHHNLLRVVFLFAPAGRLRNHREPAVLPVHVQHFFKQPQLEAVMLRTLPVIFQSLNPRRLVPARHHRQPADLQQLRRRKKHHVHRVVVNRIAQASLVNHQRPHPHPLRLHSASQPGRPRSNANNVISIHNLSISRSINRLHTQCSAAPKAPFTCAIPYRNELTAYR